MLQIEYDCLLRFVVAVLKDDDGISEHGFLRLRQLADIMHQCQDHAERSHLIEELLERTEIRHERYFLSGI